MALGLSILLVLASTSGAGIAVAEPEAAASADAAVAQSAAPVADPSAEPILLAQDGGTTPRELEPRYPAPDPGRPGPYNEQEREVWNSDYVFGITRSLVRSTIVPAGKAPLFLFTVPLDIAFLPFALIGGFFG
ncbi:MAG: hypothetical protein IPK00_22295 [Deltaproteobacteria bacterium]|nr:hypothetical protein [Deltaproteobacteria bacterium]